MRNSERLKKEMYSAFDLYEETKRNLEKLQRDILLAEKATQQAWKEYLEKQNKFDSYWEEYLEKWNKYEDLEDDE